MALRRSSLLLLGAFSRCSRCFRPARVRVRRRHAAGSRRRRRQRLAARARTTVTLRPPTTPDREPDLDGLVRVGHPRRSRRATHGLTINGASPACLPDHRGRSTATAQRGKPIARRAQDRHDRPTALDPHDRASARTAGSWTPTSVDGCRRRSTSGSTGVEWMLDGAAIKSGPTASTCRSPRTARTRCARERSTSPATCPAGPITRSASTPRRRPTPPCPTGWHTAPIHVT